MAHLWRGLISARRYTIDSASEPPEDWRTYVENGLAHGAFMAPMRPVVGEEVSGFVLPDNFLDTDFATDTMRWRFDPYVTFGFRIDKFEIPKAKAKARIGQKIRAWLAEHGVERCPKAVKTLIKEEVELELVSEGRYKTRVFDVAFNTAERTVYLCATSTGVEDLLRKRWLRCFGEKLVAAPCVPAPAGDASRRPVDQFITALLAASEIDASPLCEDDEIKLFAGDQIALAGGSDDNKVAVRGDSAPGSAEAKEAIRGGKLPSALSVEAWMDEEQHWSAVVKGELPDVTALKFTIPQAASSSFGEELVRERMFLLEGAWATLDQWGQRFAALSDASVEEIVASVRTWAKEEE